MTYADQMRFENAHIWESGDNIETMVDQLEVLIRVDELKALIKKPKAIVPEALAEDQLKEALKECSVQIVSTEPEPTMEVAYEENETMREEARLHGVGG